MKRVKTKVSSVLLMIMLMMSVSIHQSETVVALDNTPEFEQINTIHGLSHDTVYSITQDRSGFLWFGTEDGLNKYDGYTIEVYRAGNTGTSLGNANCAVVFVDEDNKVWVASWGGGIQVLDQNNSTIHSYVHDDQDPKSISDNSVHSIYKDKSGTLWFGTYTQGLNKFDTQTQTFTSYVHDDKANSISDNRVWWINETPQGKLLLGTNKGLDLFDPTTSLFTHYDAITSRVRTIFWDSKGTLWLGTQKGLCTFDLETSKKTCYAHTENQPAQDVITAIYEDSSGNFWIGTSDGLNLFDKTTGLFTRFIHDEKDSFSIGNNDIRVIFEDKSGNLWVGSRGGGVSKLNIKASKFESYHNEPKTWPMLSDVNVLSMMVDKKGVYWIGTNNGGLNLVDPVLKTQSVILSDTTKEENRNLSAILEDGDQVWVGGLGGLNKINTLTHEVMTYKKTESEGSISHNTVLSILKDHEGVIWVGTLAGLNRYDAQRDQFTRYSSDSKNPDTLSSDTINTLMEDHRGNLWIGTTNGLNRYDRATGKFTRFVYQINGENSISDNIIHSLKQTSDQAIWIGTQYGLNRYDLETGLFSAYTTKEGLPNNTIRAIQESKPGQLWISTNKGISVMEVSTSTFTNYDVLDGLQGNGYNNNATYKTASGLILFGGTNGMDLIDPTMVSKSAFMPPLVITSFKVENVDFDYAKALKDEGKISLSYEERSISVQFASLDYTLSSRNQYAYRLDGFDETWIELGTRNTIDYTNLPIGNYALWIKGTNSDGIWNEAGLAVMISVSPPWWLSNTAYVIYGLLLIVGITLIIKVISDKKEKRNRVLANRLKQSISVLSRIGEIRDTYTAGHQRRVQELSCAIASELHLTQENIDNIYWGSLIHDIGKIMIPTEYLNKPGKLMALEREILNSHVTQGCEIIEGIDLPTEVSSIVAQHHERLDGSGYPNHLAGEQIPIESRIVSVADVVEAMSSDRPYRVALGIEAALKEINENKGTKYDASVVDACIKLFKQKGFKFS
jgi:putative nucleotidyltransferase with HDIG domain